MILSVLVLCSYVTDAQDAPKNYSNEIGLVASDIDPAGIVYNRIYYKNDALNFALKTGFLYLRNVASPPRESSTLLFTLKPEAELAFMKSKYMSLSISTGILNTYELDIFKDGITDLNQDTGSWDDTLYYVYKYPQNYSMTSDISLRFSCTPWKHFRLSIGVGPRSQFSWIVQPEPRLVGRFQWRHKIALGLLVGIYYLF